MGEPPLYYRPDLAADASGGKWARACAHRRRRAALTIGTRDSTVPPKFKDRQQIHGSRKRRSPRPGQIVSRPHPDLAELLGWPWLHHAATLRHGGRGGHVSSGDDASLAWSQALESGLRPAVAPAQGRTLRRESQQAAALLSVPGDPEALAGEPSGALSRLARRDRRGHGAA